MTIAIYPGGFDPVTNGHVDIVERSALLFDEVVVAIYPRVNQLFTPQERMELLRGAVAHLPNVRVDAFEGLTVEYARGVGATVIVRGIRAVTGFEAEFDMELMNKKMAPEIESVFLMASHRHLFLSASRIREIAALGQDVSDLVPAGVSAALAQRFGRPVRR